MNENDITASRYLAWKFTTSLSLMEALAALERCESGLEWRLHESYYLGDYLLGQHIEGPRVKFFMADEGSKSSWASKVSLSKSVAISWNEVEVSFPPNVKWGQKMRSDFRDQVTGVLLPAIEATDWAPIP